MPIEDLKTWLAPWEKDKDGKKLDTPAEIDPERLKKYLHGLLSDKEKTQEEREDVKAQLAQAEEALATVQRENETKEQTAAREAREQQERYAALEKRNAERDKVDAIQAAFEAQGITATQARKLASRVKGDDEKAWVKDAKELVEDGFKVGTAKPAEQQEDLGNAVDEDLRARPVSAVRSDGTPIVQPVGRKKSVAEELAEAIPVSSF